MTDLDTELEPVLEPKKKKKRTGCGSLGCVGMIFFMLWAMLFP